MYRSVQKLTQLLTKLKLVLLSRDAPSVAMDRLVSFILIRRSDVCNVLLTGRMASLTRLQFNAALEKLRKV